MPYFLVAVGVVMIVTSLNNTYATLGSLLQSDFTGQGNFIYWVAAIVILGGIGYYAPAKPLSRAFLVLIIVTMLISNGGFATNLINAINSGPAPATPAPVLSPTPAQAVASAAGLGAGAAGAAAGQFLATSLFLA